MVETDWQEKEIRLDDIPKLYQDLEGQWLLFEVLESGGDGSPKKLRLHGHAENKDALREMMLERDDWSWKRQFLLVRADPNRCDLA